MLLTNRVAVVLGASAEGIEAFAHETPLGRIGYVPDFANAALWLAGPSFITGVNLQVNGGLHLNRFPRLDELPDMGAGYAEAAPLHDRRARARKTGDAT